MKAKLPKSVQKYFWGDNLSQLNWNENKKYIIEKILDKGDSKSIKWLFKKVNKKEVKNNLSEYNLSPMSKNFWEIYLEDK